jgi:hypothetical protein
MIDGNTNKEKTMTKPQAELFASLPDFFFIFEDFSRFDCPPTIVKDLDGREVFTFGRGQSRAFKSLLQKGFISKIGDKEQNGVPFGKN